VTARCGATTRLKIFSIAAPSAGRDVAMRRDRGCAVEVRCLLLHDRRPLRRELHSWALRLPILLGQQETCVIARWRCTLSSALPGPSRTVDRRHQARPCCVCVCCVLRGLANVPVLNVGHPARPQQMEMMKPRPTTRTDRFDTVLAGRGRRQTASVLPTLARFQALKKRLKNQQQASREQAEQAF
jgi:hypothetical protein